MNLKVRRPAALNLRWAGLSSQTSLLRLHYVFHEGFAAPFYCDDFVNWRIAARSNVNDIVTGIKGYVHWSGLVQHVLVDCDLRSLGLSMNADRALVDLTFFTEQLRHFADRLHVLDIAESAQGGREIEGLSENELRIHGLVKVAFLANQDQVLAFANTDLGGRFRAYVFAVDVDVRTCRIAFDDQGRGQLREMDDRNCLRSRSDLDAARVSGISRLADGDGVFSGLNIFQSKGGDPTGVGGAIELDLRSLRSGVHTQLSRHHHWGHSFLLCDSCSRRGRGGCHRL